MSIPIPVMSKKMIMAVLGSLIAFFAYREGFDDRTVAIILSPVLAYIPSQGLADLGKEAQKEKNKNESAAIPPPTA